VSEHTGSRFFIALGRLVLRWPWAVIALWLLLAAAVSTQVPPL